MNEGFQSETFTLKKNKWMLRHKSNYYIKSLFKPLSHCFIQKMILLTYFFNLWVISYGLPETAFFSPYLFQVCIENQLEANNGKISAEVEQEVGLMNIKML